MKRALGASFGIEIRERIFWDSRIGEFIGAVDCHEWELGESMTCDTELSKIGGFTSICLNERTTFYTMDNGKKSYALNILCMIFKVYHWLVITDGKSLIDVIYLNKKRILQSDVHN